ncbi:phosphoribosyltransferase family protein [Crocinitomicaceae bacterium]|nr:phosphoribosyltransferase family protein [Crocinitomicaceae bacterium]
MQKILSQKDIEQKITRLAHQIIENTFEIKELFIGGIAGNGVIIAERIAKIIKDNSDQKITTFNISLNKNEPWSAPIELSIPQNELKHGYILLVDDVLNSGKTMQYALIKLLEQATKAIKTVALVDRQHRRYPIKADFVGLSLSTTLKERVAVDLSEGNTIAYLV